MHYQSLIELKPRRSADQLLVPDERLIGQKVFNALLELTKNPNDVRRPAEELPLLRDEVFHGSN